jgi:hypothetical protein
MSFEMTKEYCHNVEQSVARSVDREFDPEWRLSIPVRRAVIATFFLAAVT